MRSSSGNHLSSWSMSTVSGFLTSPSIDNCPRSRPQRARVLGRVDLVGPELVEVVVTGDVLVARRLLVGAVSAEELRQRGLPRGRRLSAWKPRPIAGDGEQAGTRRASGQRSQPRVSQKLPPPEVQRLRGDFGLGRFWGAGFGHRRRGLTRRTYRANTGLHGTALSSQANSGIGERYQSPRYGRLVREVSIFGRIAISVGRSLPLRLARVGDEALEGRCTETRYQSPRQRTLP